MKVWDFKLTVTRKAFNLMLVDKVVRVEGNDKTGEYFNFVGMVHEVEPDTLEIRVISGDIWTLTIDDFLREDGFDLTVFTEEQLVVFE